MSGICEGLGVQFPGATRLFGTVFIPTWNIETWFAYLDGATVDEARSDYPRLTRERECQRHVDALTGMCRAGALRQPSPPSLGRACDEYRTRLEGGRQ